MNKILMIAYHFHPDLAIGAQRTNKYAKYLPQFGWQPYVLSVDPGKYDQKDSSPPEFDCPVFRSAQWPVPDDLYLKLKKIFTSPAVPVQSGSSSKSAALVSASETARASRSWLKKLAYTISATPDSAIGWYLPAVLQARRLIRENGIDVVYTSGPPQTNHLIGYTVSKLCRLPLVLDFRDPWLFNGRYHYEYGLELSRKFDARYERKAIRRASLVLTTTDEWRDGLRQRYHPWLGDKCQTIVNGFDEVDFQTGESAGEEKDGKMTFLHAGSLYAGRNPYDLLAALGELLADKCCNCDKIRLDFYGNLDVDMNRVARIIAEYGLADIVSFSKPVVRSEYLRLLTGSSALIMFQADGAPVNIPGKAFEYLATGNEILCLTSEGATKNFMSAFEQVAIAPLDDKDLIKEAIKRIVTRLKSDSPNTGRGHDLKHITKRHLAGKFAGLLDNIVGQASSEA